jgi:hypothetical protein
MVVCRSDEEKEEIFLMKYKKHPNNHLINHDLNAYANFGVRGSKS